MYPRITTDLKKLQANTHLVAQACGEKNIDIMGVTKVFCGIPEVAQAYVDGGVKYLADSRVENLIKMKAIQCPKVLLRLPMISQAQAVVEYADISLNSEMATIKALNQAALDQGKVHGVLLMVDLGDLREGLLPEDFQACIDEVMALEAIALKGIGVNLTCYGGVIPTPENLGELVEFSKRIKEKYNLTLELVSGGNSSSYHLVENDTLPEGISNLRMGEILVLGRETAYGDLVEGMHDDVFIFESEIIELKEKDSIPKGKIGMDAFGNKPSFQDKGKRLRAILATGVQDVTPGDLIALDPEMTLLGASSDHMIWDVTDTIVPLKVGDILRFKVSYGSLLSLFTSEYIAKKFI